MNNLPKEKRNLLILVILITLTVLGGLYFGLINWQQQYLRDLATKKDRAQAKLDREELRIKNADRLEAEVVEATKKIAELEEDMAPGDPLSWFHNKMRVFQAPYKVEIPQVSAPGETKDFMAKFPYRQAVFAVGGTAHFHDLGKFIADLENHFPYFRIMNLDLMPATGGTEPEKLAFHFEIVTLLKPNSSL
jgi:Tfp pilus assembly protein PilO